MVLDAYYSNPAYRAADNLTSGWRKLPVVGTIMKTADAAYQAGDSIFKLTDTRKALRQLDEDVFDMAPGTSYTFVDPSQNNKLLGTVYRVESKNMPFVKNVENLEQKPNANCVRIPFTQRVIMKSLLETALIKGLRHSTNLRS
jgi:hypothetical protein